MCPSQLLRQIFKRARSYKSAKAYFACAMAFRGLINRTNISHIQFFNYSRTHHFPHNTLTTSKLLKLRAS